MFTLQSHQVQHLRVEMRRKRIPQMIEALRGKGLVARFDPEEKAIVTSPAAGGPAVRLFFGNDLLPTRIVRASGATQRLAYDDADRLKKIVFPTGRVLEYERNGKGELTGVTQPGYASYGLEHDVLGNIYAVTYPEGRAYRFTYGPGNRLATLEDRVGAQWAWKRNPTTGELAAIADPLGREVRFDVGAGGIPQRVTFPDGAAYEFSYDEPDVESVKAPDGTIRRFRYEGATLARIEFGSGSAVDFEIDDGGNVARAAGASSFVQFERDETGRVVKEATERGEVKYDYDPDGRLAAITNPFGSRFAYAYDADGRLQSMQIWNGHTIAFEHDGEDQISRIVYPNGVVESRAVTSSCRIGKAAVRSAAGAYHLTEYTYDASSRLAGLSERNRSGEIEYARSFAYDAEDHLTAETDALTGQPVDESDYDLKGNLRHVNGYPVTVGPNDESRVIAGVNIAYDRVGRMRSVDHATAGMQLEFGDDDLLRGVTTARAQCRYDYDPLGRRISKDDGSQFVRFGWGQHQLLWEESAEGVDSAPKRREWVFLPDSYTPVAFYEDGRIFYLQHDVRGAIVRVFDDAGELVWHAQYESFGRAHVVVQKVRQPWRLAGQYFDEESGLHYNLARYYSPGLRSYVSRDPRWIEWEATNYSYARNDPWNRADPTGGLAPLLAIGIAGAVGAAIGAATALATGGDPVAGAVGGAIAGAGAAIGVVAGLGAVGIALTALAATAVASVVESVVTAMNGNEPLCIPCIAKNAAIAVAVDIAMLGFGKYLKKPLAALLPKLTNSYSKRFGPNALFSRYTRAEAAKHVREARKIMRDAGVPAAERNQVIRSFDRETFRVERVSKTRTEFRTFDGEKSSLKGRYTSPELITDPAERVQKLALMNNSASKLGEVTIPQGSVVFTGKVAAQPKFGPGLTGGANQTFLTGDLSKYQFKEVNLPGAGTK